MFPTPSTGVAIPPKVPKVCYLTELAEMFPERTLRQVSATTGRYNVAETLSGGGGGIRYVIFGRGTVCTVIHVLCLHRTSLKSLQLYWLVLQNGDSIASRRFMKGRHS